MGFSQRNSSWFACTENGSLYVLRLIQKTTWPWDESLQKKKFTPCKLRYICMYVVLCSNTLLLRVCLHFSAACCYFSLLLLAKTTKQNWNFLLNEIFLCWELKYIITRHRNNNIGNFIETIPTFKMYCMCSMLFLVTLFRQSLVICNVLT